MNTKQQTRGRFGTVADILATLKILGVESDRFHSMLDRLPVNLWVHDENHTIIYGNSSFRENFGDCQNRMCYQCLMDEECPCSCCQSKRILKHEKITRCELCKRGNGGYDFNLFHTPVTGRNGKTFILKSSLYLKDMGILAEKHLSETGNGEEEKKFIVMCASCKRIQDRDNNWVAADSAILDCFSVCLSHSICRECAEILYPAVDLPEL